MPERSSFEALKALRNKKCWILDMDGTVYLGDQVFPDTCPFLERILENGADYLFFTNNASRSKETYVKRLAALGIPAEPRQILTSGETTFLFLKSQRPGRMVYLVGTPDLEEAFRREGIPLYNDLIASGEILPPGHGQGARSSDGQDPQPSDRQGFSGKAAQGKRISPKEEAELCPIVVSSFDTTLTYEKLNIACRLIRNGAEFLSTHPDFNCPVSAEKGGSVPDSGAICALITASTGKSPRYLGKPYEDVVSVIERHTGLDRKDMVVVGDRLYTDVAVGVNNHMDAVLVLSGETALEEVSEATVRPTYIVRNIGDLLRPDSWEGKDELP
ncbi:MAG: HAD-IIA family hydrolase [Firmicutes bacterium]|nr:HAD-IIA family hydrolase [Bacillota bacterium]